MSKEKKKRTAWDWLYLILMIAVILMIPIVGYEGYKYYVAKQEYDQIPEMTDLPPVEDVEILDVEPEEWPEEKLFVEKKRSEYQSGDLHLVIPRMKVDDDVMNGTDNAALKKGPGLYDVAQMPGEGRNSNTSIAGHRAGYGRYGNIFKEIHTMKEGDKLYLEDGEWIYIYEYDKTEITDPGNISVLYLQGFPCLTLTSCDPIGGNSERIILTAKLTETIPYEEGYRYE